MQQNRKKALQQKKAASMQRTENTIRDKRFEFLFGGSSNDSDISSISSSSSSSNCNCDLRHDCPQH